jgi:PAS domain S-box-containing protein
MTIILYLVIILSFGLIDKNPLLVFISGIVLGLVIMILFFLKRSSYFKHLKTSQEQLDLILDNTNEGFVELSPKGQITRFNAAFATMLDLSPHNIEGTKLLNLLGNTFKQDIEQAIQDCKEGKSSNYTFHYISKDSIQPKLLKFNFTPINFNNKYLGFFAIISNISNQTKKGPEQNNEKLWTNLPMDDSLVPEMLYELRSPINAILGFVELLHSETERNNRIKYLETIAKSNKQLNVLVNDLLDLSRFENNDLKINFRESNIADLLKRLHTKFQQYQKSQNLNHIELRLHITKNEIIINTDEKRLKQVFTFFLENAFDNTSDGFIEFGLTDFEKTGCAFYIRDTGSGLPVHLKTGNKHNVFKLKELIEEKGAELGINLILASQIIETLGGDITIEFYEGKGTTIYFNIENKVKALKST